MKGLIVDQDQYVANWAYTTYRLYPLPVNKALGIIDSKGLLVGACLFQGFNGVNADLSYYGTNTVTPGIVRYIAYVAATYFNVARVTVVTSQKNRRLIKALLRIGFKLEGIQRRFYGHHDNRKNTGVRLVIFREVIDRIARLDKKDAAL